MRRRRGSGYGRSAHYYNRRQTTCGMRYGPLFRFGCFISKSGGALLFLVVFGSEKRKRGGFFFLKKVALAAHCYSRRPTTCGMR
jgi:hypothetical protein